MGNRGLQRLLSAVTLALLGGTGFPWGPSEAMGPHASAPIPPAGPPWGDPLQPRPFSALTDVSTIDELVHEVRRLVAQPVDAMEMAAFLESVGVTNEIAAHRYHVPDVFALGSLVLARVRDAPLQPALRRTQPARVGFGEAVWEYARGPISLGTVVVLFLILMAYRRFGAWGEGNVLAMSVGMTGSMLVANAFTQGAARRAAIYVSRGNPRAAMAFLLRALVPAAATTLALAAGGSALAGKLVLLTPDGRVIFVCSFLALAAMWYLSSVLSVFELHAWFGIGLASGLAAGVVTDRALSSFSQLHLAAGSAVGLSTAVALMAYPIHRTVARSNMPAPLLPSAAYLLREATPYFSYGVLYVALLLAPHLIGWVGRVPDGTRLQAISTLEVALTLSLAPILASEGVAEHAAKLLWVRGRAAQVATPAHDRARFGRTLISFWRSQLATYMCILGVLSVLAAIAFQSQGERIGRLLQLANPEFVAPIAQVSLAAYLLLGVGLFNCVFAITLARPQVAVRATLLGLLATFTVGVPLVWFGHYALAPLGFVAGAIAFSAASTRAVARMLRSADYYYVASF